MVVRKRKKNGKKKKEKEDFSLAFNEFFNFNEGGGGVGQFFVIFAAILIMALFTIIAQYNTVKVQVALEDFDELSDQYKEEQPKVITVPPSDFLLL